MLGWPSDKEILQLKSVQSTPQTEIQMLGFNDGESLKYRQEKRQALQIKLPSYFKLLKACNICRLASVVKLTNVQPMMHHHRRPLMEPNDILLDIMDL